MIRAMPALRLQRTWVALTVLLTFTLRALVPAGFMLQADGAGALRLELCSAGLAQTREPSPDPPGSSTSWKHDSAQCAFSSITFQAAPAAQLFDAAWVGAHASIRPQATAGAHVPAILRTQTPRGPPLIS